LNPYSAFIQSTSKDDKVEILATGLGTFILGGSFAKDFFTTGRFDLRIFLFGLSSFILFFAISFIAKIKIRFFRRDKLAFSLIWLFFFLVGSVAAVDLFQNQFILKGSGLNIRGETLAFLAAYTLSTNLLYLLNREILQEALKKKTIYKYLIAPLNGLSIGIMGMGAIVWVVN
jgi:hypothetical protein